MKPVYVKNAETRLAGLERKVRFLERRSQTPEPDVAGDVVIADEGAPLPSRGTLDFVGDGVTATDDSGSDSTIVTIPGGDGVGGSGIQYDVENQGDTLHVEASNNIDFSVPLDVGGAALSAFGVSDGKVNIVSGFAGSLPSGIAATGVFIFAPNLTICGLPTSAPSESGRVWNDGGTLKITS